MGVDVPLSGGAGSPSNTMRPGTRSTSVPSGVLIHSAVWPQQTWAENGGYYAHFLGRGAGSQCNTMSSGARPASVPSGMFTDPTFGRNGYEPTIRGRAGPLSRTLVPLRKMPIGPEMEPGHGSSGHRVTGSLFTPGSGRVSGQTICVFRPDVVTRYLVEQQTDSFSGSYLSLSALFTVSDRQCYFIRHCLILRSGMDP